MKQSLDFTELETAYDLIAQAIDETGEGNEALFLSKLCITLAHAIPDLAVVEEAIRTARGK
jgi:hypothetical protein